MHPRIAFPNTKKWDLFTRMDEDEDEGGKTRKNAEGDDNSDQIIIGKNIR